MSRLWMWLFQHPGNHDSFVYIAYLWLDILGHVGLLGWSISTPLRRGAFSLANLTALTFW